jgi:biotin-dependent carboxylase-like uncharacterized protein
MLEVVEPGLYSTVQDAGRAGWGHLGVRRAGAADTLALAAANLLVGNAPAAPAVEMTLLGASYIFSADILVGLTGADMGAVIAPGSRRLSPGASYRVRSGSRLVFEGAEDGARTYLALAGGIDVPTVLGSASTDPVAGFGGLGGRVLQAGDVLTAGEPTSDVERRWPNLVPSSGVAEPGLPVVVRVVPGPHLDAVPHAAEEALVEQAWTVSSRADRVGLRLEGEPPAGADALDLVSLPMVPGAIQLPPSGQPIVLMPDAPTVGGYPVPAVVAAADLPRLGQLRAGDVLRLRWVTLDEARRAMVEQHERLAAIAGSLS